MKLSGAYSGVWVCLLGLAKGLPSPQSTLRMLKQKAAGLKNGDVLDVKLATPLIGANLPADTDVSVSGQASVGFGQPDVSYIYVIDTSGSTGDEDAPCDTVLECVQTFFKDLNEQAISDKSTKLAAVINFDDEAYVDAAFQDPSNKAITTAIEAGVSVGDTNCTAALLAARDLINDPSNTANTTIVVFAGDGLCNEDYYGYEDDLNMTSTAADMLGNASGLVIVHTVAIGDSVTCDESQGLENSLLDIPRNGGHCTSVPDPHTLPHIIDDPELTGLELKMDSSNYNKIPNSDLKPALPRKGPVKVNFATTVTGLDPGSHKVCVRATGQDFLNGTTQAEDCRDFVVNKPPSTATPTTQKPASTMQPTTMQPGTNATAEPKVPDDNKGERFSGLKIFGLVAVVVIVIAFIGYGIRSYRTGKETIEMTVEDTESGGTTGSVV